MSSAHLLTVALEEHMEAQRKKERELMDTYNQACSRDPVRIEVRRVPQVDPLTSRPIPSEPYKNEVSDPVNKGIDATLAERGARYGDYMEKAFIIQDIKLILRNASSWEKMDPDMRESLEMVVHKIGRIVTGDPEYLDSWTDIMGYTKLVADRLEMKAAA